MSASPSAPIAPIVSVDWLRDHQSDPSVLIVDVRPPAHHAAAHIPGAVNLDVASLRLPASDEATIAAWTPFLQKGLRNAGISADKHIVFYEDASGTLAAFGVWLLDVAGLGNGSFLDGGIRAWHAAALPLSDERITPTPSDLTITLDRARLATAGEIIADLGDDHSFQLVDTRGGAEYHAGTIPTSTHVEWTNHLAPDGTLKLESDLRALYEEAGLTPDQPAVTYCAGGFRAAHTYVVLKSLGFSDVRSYAPSWSEWGSHPDTPIEYPGSN